MPTHEDEVVQQLPPLLPVSAIPRSLHATCPPEDSRSNVAELAQTAAGQQAAETLLDSARSLQQAVEEVDATIGSTETQDTTTSLSPPREDHRNQDASSVLIPSPPRSIEIPKDGRNSVPLPTASPPASGTFPPPLLNPDTFAPKKPPPIYTSSFLRHGSKFVGTQHSDKQVYNVEVEIKHVDMNESFICGYLRIEGLAPDHPTLTTYFEGEIIGTKYTFQTRHAEWGSNEKVDMQHWNRFPPWRPLSRQARRPDFSYKNFTEREHIFMRWKEYFLVPDHRVKTISGASFEGFYYICFNQVNGSVSGIYFHSKSEKFQQLELKHVEDRGCMGALEFR